MDRDNFASLEDDELLIRSFNSKKFILFQLFYKTQRKETQTKFMQNHIQYTLQNKRTTEKNV